MRTLTVIGHMMRLREKTSVCLVLLFCTTVGTAGCAHSPREMLARLWTPRQAWTKLQDATQESWNRLANRSDSGDRSGTRAESSGRARGDSIGDLLADLPTDEVGRNDVGRKDAGERFSEGNRRSDRPGRSLASKRSRNKANTADPFLNDSVFVDADEPPTNKSDKVRTVAGTSNETVKEQETTEEKDNSTSKTPIGRPSWVVNDPDDEPDPSQSPFEVLETRSASDRIAKASRESASAQSTGTPSTGTPEDKSSKPGSAPPFPAETDSGTDESFAAFLQENGEPGETGLADTDASERGEDEVTRTAATPRNDEAEFGDAMDIRPDGKGDGAPWSDEELAQNRFMPIESTSNEPASQEATDEVEILPSSPPTDDPYGEMIVESDLVPSRFSSQPMTPLEMPSGPQFSQGFPSETADTGADESDRRSNEDGSQNDGSQNAETSGSEFVRVSANQRAVITPEPADHVEEQDEAAPTPPASQDAGKSNSPTDVPQKDKRREQAASSPPEAQGTAESTKASAKADEAASAAEESSDSEHAAPSTQRRALEPVTWSKESAAPVAKQTKESTWELLPTLLVVLLSVLLGGALGFAVRWRGKPHGSPA